ncbi:MAG: ankyrin repeat domain-containing protein, partial [Treponema sp.]|nr:ankyrin repeat domain-containing protein [Treponema sp.]
MPEIHSWNVEKIATERHIKSCEPQPFEWKKGTEYLIDFAAKNDVQKCAEFLSAGVDINSCNEFGMSALMVACDFGAMDVVRFLLTHGAVPDTQNENGLTALMIAAARNDTEMVAMLLKYGADYTMREKSGWNALMIACAEGAKDTVVQLIKTGMDLDVRNDENDSALTIAMKSGAHDCVYHLMKAGAKVDKPKKDGPKCLMFPKEDPFYDKADSYRTDLIDPRMVALKNSTTDSLRQTDVEAYISEA